MTWKTKPPKAHSQTGGDKDDHDVDDYNILGSVVLTEKKTYMHTHTLE